MERRWKIRTKLQMKKGHRPNGRRPFFDTLNSIPSGWYKSMSYPQSIKSQLYL